MDHHKTPNLTCIRLHFKRHIRQEIIKLVQLSLV